LVGGIWHRPADADPNAAEDIATAINEPGALQGAAERQFQCDKVGA